MLQQGDSGSPNWLCFSKVILDPVIDCASAKYSGYRNCLLQQGDSVILSLSGFILDPVIDCDLGIARGDFGHKWLARAE